MLAEKIYETSLRDPNYFVSGQLHENKMQWEKMLKTIDTESKFEVQDWINNGVDISKYFQHFKGNFKGRSYNSNTPPQQFFQNSSSCKPFVNFIKQELIERLKSGSLRLWGRLGECEMPHLILPITIEPTKPRLCHDERFLNLWIKSLHFQLETLKDVPRLVNQGSKMICLDEKSGYDHVKLTKESQTYFGIQFCGWVFSYTTLPFGWKMSPYIYQTIGMQVTSYLRQIGISTIQYIDDRFAACNDSTCVEYNDVVEIETLLNDWNFNSNLRNLKPNAMLYIMLQILTKLGYTLSLTKCQFAPSTCVKYLGFLVDSVQEAFILPVDKKEKFILLRESILSSKAVDLTTLQRFAGKCISMNLVVPAAKLYIRDVNTSISQCFKNSKNVSVEGALRHEIEHWRFLDNWVGCVKWRKEYHHQLLLATDASLFRYGVAVLSGSMKGEKFGDYWLEGDSRPIHLKEAEAVVKAVESLEFTLKDCRLDVLTDNTSVLYAWENQGGRDSSLNSIMKRLFQFVFERNIHLSMQYVPSADNEADSPSRDIDMSDSMISAKSWLKIELAYGPHTVDLMASDANAMKTSSGVSLRHFSKGPSPLSAGINVFAQDLAKEGNPYVFPPFVLIFPLLRLLKEQKVARCTFIAPVFPTVPIWEPFLRSVCISSFILGEKGERGVIKYPTKEGYACCSNGLKWNLKAYRLSFS